MTEPQRRVDAYGRSRKVILVLDLILALTAVIAVASLVLEYGFPQHRPLSVRVLHVIDLAVVWVFLIDRLIRLLMARTRWKQILRRNWPDYVLLVLGVAALVVSFRVRGQILGIGAAYVIVTQVYIVFVLLLRAGSLNQRAADSGVHPAKLFLFSFAVVCLVGSGLLSLPAASARPITTGHYLDALFTSVSATCVTGLITVNTGSDWTPFGQAVILCLIQLGGLGVMMFGTVLAMMMGKALGVRGTSAVGELVSAESIGDVYKIIKFIVLATLLMEAFGAALLWPMYASITQASTLDNGTVTAVRVFSDRQAIWFSVFHSISAFCNAGFSLHDANLMAGLGEGWDRPIREHWQIMGVFAPLIIVGGLGFPVLKDAAEYLTALVRKVARRGRRVVVGEQSRPRPRLSLQSRLVLLATLCLLIGGFLGFLLLGATRGDPAPGEPDDWRSMGFWTRVRESAFASVTARTAGFNTFDMNELSQAGKLWMCMLMSIGGSPAGTAGGMKTVTFVLLLVTIWSVLRRREEIEVFKRSISIELLRKTLTVAVLYILLVVTTTLGLCIALNWDSRFVDILFEACSACGTVGLSTGVTWELNAAGKVIIILAMFAGRLGPITLLVALTGKAAHVRYSYPAENLTIG